MRDLDARLGPFDGIFAQASLLHIPKNEIRATLEKLATRLSIGGCFYIAVKGMRPDGKEEEILTENDYGYPYQRFFSYYSMDELRAYLTDLKLTIIYEDSKLVGKTVWLQIVGKKSL
jgi:hypothetical protein